MSKTTTTKQAPPVLRRRNVILRTGFLLFLFVILFLIPPAKTQSASCPCSLWPGTTVPAVASHSDPQAIEVGVKFRTSVSGYITGMKFYKGSLNTGTHTANLWSAAGVKLATGTFSNESASGWQELTFAQPVAITANTIYVASYHTTSGYYSVTRPYFNTGYTNDQLSAPSNSEAGGNGVYKYGASGFPSLTYQATNYWVDVVFAESLEAPPPPDTTPPQVSISSPTPGATVSASIEVTATASDPSAGSGQAISGVAGVQFKLDGVNLGPEDTASPYSVSWDTTSSSNASHTLTAVARDVAGNSTTSVPIAVTVDNPILIVPSLWPSTAVPVVASHSDPASIEVGVKFRSTIDGYIIGLKFYKGSLNTGTHVGSLWDTSGQKLASIAFTNETASGWQQANFSQPIAVAANATYVASYFAPSGYYSVSRPYFNTAYINGNLKALATGEENGNGVYKYGASGFPSLTYQATNYWVDVVFAETAQDVTPPQVTATSPLANQVNVDPSSNIELAFSEPMDQATINSGNLFLKNSAGTAISANVSYNAAGRIAVIDPVNILANSEAYTITATTGIKDASGNSLNTDYIFSFTAAPAMTCDPQTANAIVCENAKPGSPASEWDITGAGNSNIQGFGTNISVAKGETIEFKIKTDSPNYRLDIYRIGFYAGMGARKITTVLPSAPLPQIQPNCVNDAATGLIDCGNWEVSASWIVPADTVSGVYIAKLVRQDGVSGASHVVFIVRDDESHSDMLFQTADATWQAYNNYGGNSLYMGQPAGRAYKVSYNRPFATRADGSGRYSWLFSGEYPMIRFLESNGYDVSYFTNVDADRIGAEILEHKVFLSVGHDEYWSGTQRANVEAARNAGVNLAFFSGNEVFWKTRWEPSSTDGTAYRTLVSYKETKAGAKIDPSPEWTGTWRDPRFSPPADGGRPENGLTGTIYMVNGDGWLNLRNDAIAVPAEFGNLRFWRNTSIANLTPGQTATLPLGTLGYEWDEDLDNGFRPAGLIKMSSTTLEVNGFYVMDYGASYGNGTATHNLTLYKHQSGALVFGAGTVQWSWGLDGVHDNGSLPPDVRMQQATVNLFADMGVQTETLIAGLVPASGSTDTIPPVSIITFPGATVTVPLGTQMTITGTASDTGGAVAGVEVSINGGQTWHQAAGRENWQYTFVNSTAGELAIRSRAIDDIGNIEQISAPPPNSLPVGVFDEIRLSDGVIRGWTYDPDISSQSNTAQIFFDGPAGTGTLATSIPANVFRPDVNTAYEITGNHGFEFTIPESYRDGMTHSVYIYGLDINASNEKILLIGSPMNFTLGTPPPPPPPAFFNGHAVSLDQNGKLVSWLPGPNPYEQVVNLAWDYIKNNVPDTVDGIKHYLSYCCFTKPAGGTFDWYHNPAGLYAMFVDSYLPYYAYSGDSSALSVIEGMLDYQLAHGMTPASWNWPNMPYASARNGNVFYEGDGNALRDGVFGIEPDKAAESAVAYLKFWELTGIASYRDAAINVADTLASHIRSADATHSPWPFRVNAQTGEILEEYTANAVPAVKLFDELTRLNLGNVGSYQTARNLAWNWIMAYPMANNQWNAYFEDIERNPDLSNFNQIVPMETARYILDRADPGDVDPLWQTHIPALLAWVQTTFGKGPFYGAQAIDEQTVCCSDQGLGSHTARWAAINALMYEKTGLAQYKENAYRAFNYATYFADDQGVVMPYFDAPVVWYSDGYGDYIKHFMTGFAAVPEWASTNANHILKSTSVVKTAVYIPTQIISYTTFDQAATETLRVTSMPIQIMANGVALPQRTDLAQQGWIYDSVSQILKIRHDSATDIFVTNVLPEPSAPTLQTITFDDLAGQDKILTGQYPVGVVNWGTGTWWHSAPWGLFTTKNVSFNGNSIFSANFTFVNPKILVRLDAYNGGTSPTTVTLKCAGLADKQVTVPDGTVVTIETGWTGTCSTVTVLSANGWFTNFDNLAITSQF